MSAEFFLGLGIGSLAPFAVIFAVDKVQRCHRPRAWWTLSHVTVAMDEGVDYKIHHEHRYAMARWTSRRLAAWHFDTFGARRCHRRRLGP